jgi:prophage tail gpP-like protein
MAALRDLAEDGFLVELENGDLVTDKVVSYRIQNAYTTPTDSFEFVVYSEDDPRALRRRWRPLQPVKISIAGRQQLIGRIDGIRGEGQSGRLLRVRGRDYLADLVDSSADPTFQIKKGQDLGDFLLDFLKPWGIVTVLSDFNLTRNAITGRVPYSKKRERQLTAAQLDDQHAGENQGAHEFIAKVITRHGATIQPAGTRDTICVDQPNYDQAPLYKLTRTLEGGGNLLSGVADRNYEGAPTVTLARGRSGGSEPGKQSGSMFREYPSFDKTGPTRMGASLECQRIVTSDDGIVVVREKRFDPKSRKVEVFGFDFPVYKPLYYKDKDSRNQEQLDYSVRRMVAEKLRDTLVYTCTVRGHVDPESEALWGTDTIATVYDEIEDVDEPLWIHDRTLSNDGSGPRTELNLFRPGSYVFG